MAVEIILETSLLLVIDVTLGYSEHMTNETIDVGSFCGEILSVA